MASSIRPIATSIRKVKSADRTLDVLEALAVTAAPMSAAELAAALDIPKSSLFHLIGTLIDRRYLQDAGGGRYALGPRLREIVKATEPDQDLARLVDPILRDFTEAINETTGFSIQRGDEVEVVSTRIGSQALTYTMSRGDLAPLYAISSGKALLAEKSKEWLDDYLARVRFEKFTPNTIQSHDRLIREIERARIEGVGHVDQEFTPGIVGMAAAVRAHGRVVGAVNVAMPNVRANAETLAIIRQKLFSAVRRAENALAECFPAYGPGAAVSSS